MSNQWVWTLGRQTISGTVRGPELIVLWVSLPPLFSSASESQWNESDLWSSLNYTGYAASLDDNYGGYY